ncbi:MAG TPA: haloacid dehalogenase type II [Steroidobacteraceae bacterium]
MSAPLAGIRACVFDAYGTLFDYASAAARCSDVLGDKVASLTTLWRTKQLEYTWLRSLQGRYVGFSEVTSDALDFALAALGLSDPKLHTRLMSLYSSLECFPEVPAMLARVKAAGIKLAILSNGSPQLLAAALDHSKLAHCFDAVLSVDEVGVYKPHPMVYQLAVDRLGVPAGAIAFQSSNGWDAYAASAFGMRVVWCNRYGQPSERLPGRPEVIIQSLAELPALVGA